MDSRKASSLVSTLRVPILRASGTSLNRRLRMPIPRPQIGRVWAGYVPDQHVPDVGRPCVGRDMRKACRPLDRIPSVHQPDSEQRFENLIVASRHRSDPAGPPQQATFSRVALIISRFVNVALPAGWWAHRWSRPNRSFRPEIGSGEPPLDNGNCLVGNLGVTVDKFAHSATRRRCGTPRCRIPA